MKRMFSSSCCRYKIKFQENMDNFENTAILRFLFCFSDLHERQPLERVSRWPAGAQCLQAKLLCPEQAPFWRPCSGASCRKSCHPVSSGFSSVLELGEWGEFSLKSKLGLNWSLRIATS